MSTSDLNFIHCFVAATEPNLPTLLLLHGTGGNENDLLAVGEMLAPGAALLSPRGKVLEHGMSRFFRRLAEGIFDVEDLIARTHELADFVTAAALEYGFDPTRVIAAGFSNGANIAGGLLMLRPEILQSAILFHPMTPLEPQTPPDLTGKRVFIGAGREDSMISTDETERLAALLQRDGAIVNIFWTHGGHNLSRDEVGAAKEWLAGDMN